MANRPIGGAPTRQRQVPAPSPQPQPRVHQSTARVAVLEPPRSPVPGWFFGALGCLSVLIIGFAVMAGLSNIYVWVILIAALLIFFLMYMPRKEQREGRKDNLPAW